ncbi:MAG: hypothetical protein AAB288_02915 [Acidobacteriota bacterium]
MRSSFLLPQRTACETCYIKGAPSNRAAATIAVADKYCCPDFTSVTPSLERSNVGKGNYLRVHRVGNGVVDQITMNTILVGIGGMLGSVLRYLARHYITTAFPWRFHSGRLQSIFSAAFLLEWYSAFHNVTNGFRPNFVCF